MHISLRLGRVTGRGACHLPLSENRERARAKVAQNCIGASHHRLKMRTWSTKSTYQVEKKSNREKQNEGNRPYVWRSVGFWKWGGTKKRVKLNAEEATSGRRNVPARTACYGWLFLLRCYWSRPPSLRHTIAGEVCLQFLKKPRIGELFFFVLTLVKTSFSARSSVWNACFSAEITTFVRRSTQFGAKVLRILAKFPHM